MLNELRRTNSSPAVQSIQRRFDNRIDNQHVHRENLFESTPKGNPIMYTLLVFSTCGMSVELRFIILNSKRLNRILYLNICFVATICYCRYYTTFAEQLFFTSALNCHYVVFNLLMASAIIPDQYPGKYGELKT